MNKHAFRKRTDQVSRDAKVCCPPRKTTSHWRTPQELPIRIATAVISEECHAIVGTFREFQSWQKNNKCFGQRKEFVTLKFSGESGFQTRHSLSQMKDYLEIKNQWYFLIENASN